MLYLSVPLQLMLLLLNKYEQNKWKMHNKAIRMNYLYGHWIGWGDCLSLASASLISAIFHLKEFFPRGSPFNRLAWHPFSVLPQIVHIQCRPSLWAHFYASLNWPRPPPPIKQGRPDSSQNQKLLLLQLIVTPVSYFLWSTIKWIIQH